MLDGVASPPPAHEPERLLEDSAAGGSVDAENRALARMVEPRNEAEQQPPIAQAVQLRELLGQQERVASQRHDVRPQPQATGPSGDQRQPEQRVEDGSKRNV